ncbi:uncharacterized protein KIAA1614 homolog [Suncus etruscus]|uniref:uncharacterized protein KIAA1614 homolog n=1 Tax=Suncus etruscus TaxID=109475 RepID=UPI00210FB411|nr:uncharacterized protein KIAA1614 homolog [Suncus etruscus]
MALRPPRICDQQPQDLATLESTMRALRVTQPGSTQGSGLGPAPYQKPQCQQVKVTRVRTPSAGSFQLERPEVLPAQSLTDGHLDGSGCAEEGASSRPPKPPRLPTSGLESWHRWGPQPLDAGRVTLAPEQKWTLEESHGLRPSQSLPDKTPPVPGPRTGQLYRCRDRLDSSSLTSGPAPFWGLWQNPWRGPGIGRKPLPLSERVEKNRLLLREMLSVGGPATRKPSWDRTTPEFPSPAEVDSEQSRTCRSPSEPTHKPSPEQPLHARIKARTRPLRANHDIMPSLALDSGRAILGTPRKLEEQAEATDPPRSRLLGPQHTQSCARHPPLASSNCTKGGTPGEATVDGAEVEFCGLKPQRALEEPRNGGPQAVVGCALSKKPQSSQEAEGTRQRAESTSGCPTSFGTVPPQIPKEFCETRACLSCFHQCFKHNPTNGCPSSTSPCPSRAPWHYRVSTESQVDQDGKSSGGRFASGLGLRKLFSGLGKSRSHSVGQLEPTSGPDAQASTPEVRRTPSFQLLHLVSRSPQHPKAASCHNLQALLSRGDRASLYMVEEPEGDGARGSRPVGLPPQRALSVEDVGAPSLARPVGRLMEAFPDGTSQLQLQCTPGGNFGFCVATGNGRRDSGLYVREMADVGTAKLYSGLLAVGDEILEVDGAKVAALGTAHVQQLLACTNSVSLRVLRQRPTP